MNVIVAPHPDDEIIACYEILESSDSIIIYNQDTTPERKLESLNLKQHFSVCDQIFSDIIPSVLLENFHTFYFPDPCFEFHPDHRRWGSIGEKYLHEGYNVVFYTVNMQVPYIHKVQDPCRKESILNSVYPSQKSLWKYEKKYILFEGRVKWMV